MNRNLGALHEPVWEKPSLDSTPLEHVPSVIVPPRGNPTRIAKEPGPLHEAVWEQQLSEVPLDFSRPEWNPGVMAQQRCQDWMNKQISPLHEPVWNQPSGSLSPELVSPIFIPPCICQQEQKSVTSGLGQKPLDPLGKEESSKKKKGNYPGPLHEQVWEQPLLNTPLPDAFPLVLISTSGYQKGKEKEPKPLYDMNPHTSGSVPAEQSSSNINQPGSSKKGKGRYLGPLHEPTWEQPILGPSLGSSFLIQSPSVAIPASTHEMMNETDSHPEQSLHTSQSKHIPLLPKVPSSSHVYGGRYLGPLHKTNWEELPVTSTPLLKTPLASIPPGSCQTKTDKQETHFNASGSFPKKQSQPVAIKPGSSAKEKEKQLGPLQAPVWYRLTRHLVPLHQPAWE